MSEIKLWKKYLENTQGFRIQCLVTWHQPKTTVMIAWGLGIPPLKQLDRNQKGHQAWSGISLGPPWAFPSATGTACFFPVLSDDVDKPMWERNSRRQARVCAWAGRHVHASQWWWRPQVTPCPCWDLGTCSWPRGSGLPRRARDLTSHS